MLNVLTCNAGSSSIKFHLIEAVRERLLLAGEVEWSANGAGRLVLRSDQQPEVRKELKSRNPRYTIRLLLAELEGFAPTSGVALDGIHAVGHRVVHGGPRYTSAVRIVPEIQKEIEELTRLAPLHNAASVEVIDAVGRLLPGVPQVAAFDTGFHATLPEVARTYAVPHRWTADWGIRRYGFHGLNHSYCAGRAAEMISGPRSRLIVAHLGSGASISAVRDGACVDTSMGFTPLDGLMMGTRSGAVDPGILIHVLRERGLSADQLDHALNHESGLLGVSGVSSDMREVLNAAARGEPRARLAVDLYVRRVQQTVGAMAAILGGVDGLVFTAGVGEHAPLIRQRVCESLSHLGLMLDPAANLQSELDADVATGASPARILVIAAREELAIVREVRRLIKSGTKQGVMS